MRVRHNGGSEEFVRNEIETMADSRPIVVGVVGRGELWVRSYLVSTHVTQVFPEMSDLGARRSAEHLIIMSDRNDP